MNFFGQITQLHVLLWIVPLVVGLLLAIFGAHVRHRFLAAIAFLGALWPVVHSVFASIFFLWGHGWQNNTIVVHWMTGDLFALSFRLDLTGAWASLVLSFTVLATLIYSFGAVSKFAGRHRFYALMELLVASSNVLFTSWSEVGMLVGWEGIALSVAFLAGFWESERAGERTGMRWLLFQRASGLLLLFGLLGIEKEPELGLILVVLAIAIRAGQFPFHGWLRDTVDAPAPASALILGAASSLASIFLLLRMQNLLHFYPVATDVLGSIGIGAVALGFVSGLQQRRSAGILGWLFVMMGGLSLLAFAVDDPVAASLLVTSQTLTMAGLAMIVGSLDGLVAQVRALAEHGTIAKVRSAFLIYAAAWFLPPSLGLVGMGRLLSSSSDTAWYWPVLLSVCACTLAGGWIGAKLYTSLRSSLDDSSSHGIEISMALAPAVLGAVNAALGIAALTVYGWSVVGEMVGLKMALIASGSGLAGFGVAWWMLGRKRVRFFGRRLTRAQRVMEWIAETGLGLGEVLVLVPVFTARILGVVVWRVMGDAIIDTLIVGTTYKTVEGVGFALRMLQNGRVQRYALVAVLTTLVVMLIMLR